MSSLCPNRGARLAGALALAALALAACGKGERNYAAQPPSEGPPETVAVSGLFPGGGQEPPEDPRDKIYEGNPQYIAEGHRLYQWYNCNGCHFNGGGGIGPALMSGEWRYGGRLDQIYTSILQGRPNGMPTWRGKIPDAQIWEIAAYVKSMSAPNAANGSEPGKENGGIETEETPSPPPAPAAPSPPPQSSGAATTTTPPQ